MDGGTVVKRKIIQIAVLLEGNCHYLYALCDDGSLWLGYGGTWKQMGINTVVGI